MHLVFEIVLLVGTVIVVSALAGRVRLPAPLALIAVGIVGSYLSFVPQAQLSSELVLFGLLPPLLYTAALQTSLVDFAQNRIVIGLLSVGLVIFTAAGVGVVVHLLLPGTPWATCFAIGAVVAPPDAVAATSIGRRIGLPRRIVTVLEGESLFNDATALVALRTALAATVAWHQVALGFVMAALGGALVGFAFFLVIAKVRRRITDPMVDSSLSFLIPFAAYATAEEIHVGGAHASGVIAVVVAGLLLGHKSPILQTAQSRIAERLNWASISFLLEGVVFLLIGLQARWIIGNAGSGSLGWGRVIAVCAATLVAVIVLRLVWVMVARSALVRSPGRTPTTANSLLLGWAGMRGVVTLAAAFVIPEGTPHRDVLLLIAFTVTAGTLFIQGLTLPLLARRLEVEGPDPAEDALARASLIHQATQAGLVVLDELEEDDPHDVATILRDRVERRDQAAWERMGASVEETPAEIYNRRRRLMIDAERAKVLEVRSTGTVAHEVVEEVLAMLDVEESMLEYAGDERERIRGAKGGVVVGDRCEDLSAERASVTPETEGQCDDCLASGSTWVHLRMCEACGKVACCDSSPSQHATAHFRESGHPVMRSAEPGEHWRWCFVHELTG